MFTMRQASKQSISSVKLAANLIPYPFEWDIRSKYVYSRVGSQYLFYPYHLCSELIAWDRLSVCLGWVGYVGESQGQYKFWSCPLFTLYKKRYKKGENSKFNWSSLLLSYIINLNVQSSLPPTPPTPNTQKASYRQMKKFNQENLCGYYWKQLWACLTKLLFYHSLQKHQGNLYNNCSLEFWMSFIFNDTLHCRSQ